MLKPEEWKELEAAIDAVPEIDAKLPTVDRVKQLVERLKAASARKEYLRIELEKVIKFYSEKCAEVNQAHLIIGSLTMQLFNANSRAAAIARADA